MSIFSRPDPMTLIVTATIGITVLILVTAYAIWRRRIQPEGERQQTPVKCRFVPGKVQVRGQHGDVLRLSAKIEGPPGLTFATFVEEPWIVASPLSGMVPEDVQVEIHTAHAPREKRQNITLRVLPIDGQVPCENLTMDIRLKMAKGEGPARLHHPASKF